MPAHLALEARIGALDTPSAYNEYVAAMLAFRGMAEAWLAHEPPQSSEWQPHVLTPMLRQDAEDLRLSSLAAPKATWGCQDRIFALGVHYVLEGSALGARILCKRVEQIGLHRDYGARHLWAQSERAGHFRTFVDLLHQRAPALDEARRIAGANAAFEAAAEAMERAANA